MLRFYLIATAVVLTALLAISYLPHQARSVGDPRYSSGRGTPGPAQRDDRPGTTAPTIGNAPWALDALPDCFFEVARTSGTPAFVRTRRPAGVRPLPPGTVLHVGDCSLAIGAGRAVVARGADRLVIPPVAHFYLTGPRRIVLDRASGGREDVRTFELRGTPAPP